MIFQSRWNNAVYTVDPRATQPHPITGSPVLVAKGMKATFTGTQRLFDSVTAQKTFGWTDEERIKVEKHLLESDDFGVNLFLAPGQDIPEELLEKQPAVENRCTHIFVEGDKIIQCDATADRGSEYCAVHNPEIQKVVKGVGSTFGSETTREK